MSFFTRQPISATRRDLRCSEAEALRNLEQAAAWIVKHARWIGLAPSKVHQLRKPLLQIRLARRQKPVDAAP